MQSPTPRESQEEVSAAPWLGETADAALGWEGIGWERQH